MLLGAPGTPIWGSGGSWGLCTSGGYTLIHARARVVYMRDLGRIWRALKALQSGFTGLLAPFKTSRIRSFDTPRTPRPPDDPLLGPFWSPFGPTYGGMVIYYYSRYHLLLHLYLPVTTYCIAVY